MTLYGYLRAAVLCGYDAKTALMLPPAVIYDTMDAIAEQNKPKDEVEDY